MKNTENNSMIQGLLNEITPSERYCIRQKMRTAVVLENLMKQKGYSKGSLAVALKKKPSVITKWLSGTHNFTIETLADISFLMGVSLSVFFEEERVVEHVYREHLSVTNVPITGGVLDLGLRPSHHIGWSFDDFLTEQSAYLETLYTLSSKISLGPTQANCTFVHLNRADKTCVEDVHHTTRTLASCKI